MSIGFRASSNSGASNVAAATVTATKPTGTTSTDALFLEIFEGRIGNSTLGAYSPPAGWTRVGAQVTATPGAGGDTAGVSVFWAAGDVASLAFTRTGTVDFAGWQCVALTGVNLATPVDATATGNSSLASTSLVTNEVTVATAGAWHLIPAVDWNAATLTATGFTTLANYVVRFLYNTTAKSIGGTGSVTLNSGGVPSGEILLAQPFAVRPAGAGGGGGLNLNLLDVDTQDLDGGFARRGRVYSFPRQLSPRFERAAGLWVPSRRIAA